MLYKHANLVAAAKIGLEVHAQLNIRSKLFSLGANSSRAKSNSQLDLLDIALPGSLPKVNKHAFNAAILSSLGLNCKIQEYTHFDRKNYFYTDMPAGFQLTQYNNPIARDGHVEFIVRAHHKSVVAHAQRYDVVKYLYHDERKETDEIEPYIGKSQIKQVQLEQDSAKTLLYTTPSARQEVELCSLVDYNRSGVGLIEIVFEPDLTNHHEAASLVKELILILKSLKTCDCELQDGSLRVDANVSIKSIDNQEIDSARVELKNMNSLKALSKGILNEIYRQTELIGSNTKVIQETRTYDTKTNTTKPLRIKEEAVDYRYVPEPSIPPIRINQELVEVLRKTMPPITSNDMRRRLVDQFKIDLSLVSELMEEPGLSDYLLAIISDKPEFDADIISDFLIYAIANLKETFPSAMEVDLVNQDSQFLQRFTPPLMQSIFKMMSQDEISYATAYEVIKYIFTNSSTLEPRAIVEQFDWFQITDKKRVADLCSDLTKKMKNISKKYATRGEKRYLLLMLNKLGELTDNRVSVKIAIDVLNESLKPPKINKVS